MSVGDDEDFKAVDGGTVQAAASSMRNDDGTWKDITGSAGIGEGYKKDFVENGYSFLYNLLGNYLSLNCDKHDFMESLTEICESMSAINKKRCWACIAKYVEDNM